MEFPIDRRYFVRNKRTNIVHVAMAFDNGYIAALIEHATWCSEDVNERDWELAEDASPNCLCCVTETHYDYGWGLKWPTT